MGPVKKSSVYQWVEASAQSGEISMHNDIGPMWKRVKLTRVEADELWDDYLPSQRRYDEFRDQWDLLRLLDYNAGAVQPGNQENDNEDNDKMDDTTHIDKIQLAFFDQLKDAPVGDAYTSVAATPAQIQLEARAEQDPS